MKALRTFIKLAENNCDFGVHKFMGIPRSTMWGYITELEKETGLTLIDRRKQNSVFTEQGKNFVPYARKIITTFEEALDKTKLSQERAIEGELLISMTSAIANAWFLQSIKGFDARYPKLKINVIAEDILSKKTEHAANALLRPIGNNISLIKKWYVSYSHGLYASKEYLMKHGTPEKPEDLLNHKILGYGDNEFTYFEDINWHLKGHWGLPKLKPSLTINSTSALFLAAVEGIGICPAAAESLGIYNRHLVRVLPYVNGPELRSYFCIKSETSPAMLKIIDIFRIYFEQYLGKMGVKINYS